MGLASAKTMGFGAFGEAQEDVGSLDGFGQGVDVAVGGEEAFLLVQPFAVLADDAFAVEHDDVLQAGSQRDV